jgi:hypothetical protein
VITIVMQLLHRSVFPLVAICLGLAAGTASAGKPAPTRMTPPSGNTPIEHQGPCQLGVLPPATNIYTYVLPPDDIYYTLVEPENCPACLTPSLTTAQMQVSFAMDCEIVVSVSVVGAVELSPGCLGPNPADVLCTPMTYNIDSGGVLNECFNRALPLAADCCIHEPAFLAIEFDEGTCKPGQPAFCGPDSCEDCTQYNIFPAGPPPPGDDLCVVLDPFDLTGNIMYADADCCDTTGIELPEISTLPASWGLLKALYR